MERGRTLSITVASQPDFGAAPAFVNFGDLPALPVLELTLTPVPPGPRVGTCTFTGFASSLAEALGVKPPRKEAKVDPVRQFRRWWVTLALADDWTRLEFQRGYRTHRGARQAARDWRAGRFGLWVCPDAFTASLEAGPHAGDTTDTNAEDSPIPLPVNLWMNGGPR